MADVIVLGAGMVGVATALQLQKRGLSVALVDRTAPGRETSYGNAGIIQSEAVEPYALPRNLATLLAIALGRSNDVNYHWSALPSFAGPLLRYWWHSAPARHARVSKTYAELIAIAIAEHAPFIDEAGAGDLIAKKGFRQLYRSQQAFDEDVADARRIHERHGVPLAILDPDEMRAAEPALKTGGVGAIHWTGTWTASDPGGLVEAYADLFARSGGTLATGDATTLAERSGGGWRVATDDGPLEAERVVVALGPWSPQLLERFGYNIPMVRKRGYHRHYRQLAPVDAPFIDMEWGYVVAPMRAGLRITTGAEIAAQDAPQTPVQLARCEKALGELIDLGAPVENRPWMGARPCMPDMLPVVGEAPRHKGLWMHFGHGHQGFTLGPATGRMLAELMTGETPFEDATLLSAARFG
ncbi:MAG: amino acid dehydrogenase [Hyphomicrobiales bacterium]|nr:MAG: amino acid dehydrogenase [Hyphomicrobiales bacterium]